MRKSRASWARRRFVSVDASRAAAAVLLLLLFIQTTWSFVTTKPAVQSSSSTWLFVGRKTMEERNLTTATATPPDCLVDFGNFWRKTHANFTACDRPLDPPTFTSKSGSVYWDLGHSVVRYSNHWTGQHGITKIVDCYWTLDAEHDRKEFVCGRCQYIDFIPRKKIKKPSNNKKKPRGFAR